MGAPVRLPRVCAGQPCVRSGVRPRVQTPWRWHEVRPRAGAAGAPCPAAWQEGARGGPSGWARCSRGCWSAGPSAASSSAGHPSSTSSRTWTTSGSCASPRPAPAPTGRCCPVWPRGHRPHPSWLPVPISAPCMSCLLVVPLPRVPIVWCPVFPCPRPCIPTARGCQLPQCPVSPLSWCTMSLKPCCPLSPCLVACVLAPAVPVPTSPLSPCPRCLADCSGQDEQFSLVFTIGSFMNNFMTLPMGYVFDRFGTAVARLIAISLYTGGTLLVAFSTPDLAVLLFPAMSMLSVGGILLILTNMQVGNLFGKYRSIVITLYNGAFDSSSAIFLIIKVLYERGLPLQAMFFFMAACSAWHLLRTLFLMPRTRIPYPLPPAYNYGLQCPGRSQSYRTYEEKRPPGGEGPEEVPLEPSAPKGGTAAVPFRPCVLSWLFFWHVVWLSVMQLRHYLFIGTLNPLLDHLARGDASLVSTYTNAFAFTQLCGVLCAPWNGLILDRHKRGKAHLPEGARGALADLQASVLSLVVTVTQCVLFSICAAVPMLPVQFATFVLQVISRSFLYGGNAAFLAIAFPPQHFGKLYGLAMALSALVALLQYPCITLVRGVLKGDPFYVNVGLIAVVLVAFVSPVVVARECRRRAKDLEAVSSPLDAPPSAETPAQTPH